MSWKGNTIFWIFSTLAAAGGLVALMLPEHAGDRQDCLTIVDWKLVLHPGKPQEHPFVVYAGECAWVEIHVDAPETEGGIDIVTSRDAGPVKDLSAEKIFGKKTLSGIVPGDVYSISMRNRGSSPAQVHVLVVRDYGK